LQDKILVSPHIENRVRLELSIILLRPSVCIPFNVLFSLFEHVCYSSLTTMESGGPSGEEDQWVHWEDLIDGLPDADSNETDSQYGGNNVSTDNVRNYLDNVLEQLFEMAQHYEIVGDQLPPVMRIPQRTSILRGPMWIHWVLTNLNLRTCKEQFRMSPTTFCRLCNTLKNNHLLKSSWFVKITEQVATFLLVVCQGHTIRVVVDRLQRSFQTIHKYSHQTCRALCRLRKTVIQPTAKDTPHPYVSSNGKFYPWFGVSHIPWVLNRYFKKYVNSYASLDVLRIHQLIFCRTALVQLMARRLTLRSGV